MLQAVDNTYDQNYEEKRYSSEQSGTSNRGKVSSEQRGYSCGQPVDNTYDQNYEERRYSSEQRGSSNQATFSSERRGYSSGQRRYSVDPHLSVYQQQLPDMRGSYIFSSNEETGFDYKLVESRIEAKLSELVKLKCETHFLTLQ